MICATVSLKKERLARKKRTHHYPSQTGEQTRTIGKRGLFLLMVITLPSFVTKTPTAVKKYLLIVMMGLSNLFAEGQNYVPFPTANAVWRGERNYIEPTGGLPILWHYVDFNQFIGSDTMINGLVYHNLMETSVDNLYQVYPGQYLISSTNNGPGLIGRFREDSNKRIYYFGYFTTDSLLFDFNLSVGDTFQSTLLNASGYLKVTAIDSVFDGLIFRKKYILDTDTISFNDPPWFLIEGIGSNGGFAAEILPGLEYGSSLYCYRENNIIKYSDSIHNCSLVGMEEVQSDNIKLTIFPNPTTNQLTIETNSTSPLFVILYDIASRKILEKEFINRVTLNTEELSKGIYIYEVRDKGVVVKNGKVVKE